MKRRILAVLLTVMMTGTILAGCGSGESGNSTSDSGNTAKETAEEEDVGETEIQVFIAASLNTVMTELVGMYQETHPEVKITYNADSSGTLLTQIEEGYECDIFFSAVSDE